MNKGRLIVIEGACDGIGKTTQFELLKKRLISEGYNIFYHHFPSYGTPQGALVEKYLNGDFGTPSELSPHFIHKLFADDRIATWNEVLKKEIDKGSIILLDRYTTSSLLYQSSGIDDLEEKKVFLEHVVDYEYNKGGIGRPDKVIFLTAPYEVAKRLREKRPDNEGIKNDVHERDENYMRRVYDNSIFVSEYFAWNKIECSNNLEEIRKPEDIHEEIYSLIRKK